MDTKNNMCAFCDKPNAELERFRLTVSRRIKPKDKLAVTEELVMEIPICHNCHKHVSQYTSLCYKLFAVMTIIAFVCLMIGIFQKQLFSHSFVGALITVILIPIGLLVFCAPGAMGYMKIEDSFFSSLSEEPLKGLAVVIFLEKNGFDVSSKEYSTIVKTDDESFMDLKKIKDILKNTYHTQVL